MISQVRVQLLAFSLLLLAKFLSLIDRTLEDCLV